MAHALHKAAESAKHDLVVELHELRPDAAVEPDWETAPCQGRYLGLHAKLYTIDGQRIFLGSVNLDPRSKLVNTEVGILVEDPDYTKEMADGIEQLMTPENSWRVELDPDGRLVWHDDEGTTHRQPARSPLQRIADRAYEILPINPYI